MCAQILSCSATSTGGFMNFSRKTILVVGAAMLAACGDKVTVSEYTPPATVAKVNSVEVAPATATMNIGQTITLTAAVNADAGVATTVTWNSSDATKASVSTAGVVTAVAATPGVAICATSTVDTGKKGCASVTVTAATAVIPASVSINSITATGNLNTTVNPANVAGGIDVTLNVNPGNQTISKIVLIVGGIRQDSQVYTAAQAAALRYSADQAVAEQSTFPQVVFSVNTAAYTAATGAPRWLNGQKAISAQLYTTQAGATTAATATAQTNLTFNNVDGFAVSYTAPTTAVDAAGYRWSGNGALSVSAIPVMYSGSTVGTVTAFLGANTIACAAVGATASTTTLTGAAYVISLPLTATQSPAGCATTTPNLVNVTATNSAGDNLTLVNTGLVNTQTGIRYDNVAPASPIVNAQEAVTIAVARTVNPANAMPNGRRGAWLNDAVTFNGLATYTATSTSGNTSNGMICNNSRAVEIGNCPDVTNLNAAQNAVFSVTAPADGGVGGVTYSMNVAATTTVATAAAAAAITSASGLAAAATNATYCGVAYAADALGNKSATNPMAIGAATTTCAGYIAAGALNVVTFGVDRVAPTIAWDATAMAANGRRNAGTIAGEFIVTVADTGIVGNSGMLPSAPVLMAVSQRTAAATNNLTAAGAAAASSALSATGVAAAAPLYSTAITGLTTAAYYTTTALAQDAAGNQSASINRVIAYDAAAAVATAPAVPATITMPFSAASFLNDNLSIRDWYTTQSYTMPAYVADSVGGVGAISIIDPSFNPLTGTRTVTAVDGYNVSPLSNTNLPISYTVGGFAAVQTTTGGAAPVTYVANANKLAATNLFVRDQTQAAYSAVTTAAVPTTAASLGVSIQAPNWATFSVATSGAGCAAIVCAVAGGNNNVTVTATAVGTTAIFNNPFSRVDFYVSNGTSLVLLGSSTLISDVDNGATRTFTWSTTVGSNALFVGLGGNTTAAAAPTRVIPNVYAFGVNAAGTLAMISQPAILTINQ